MRACRPRRPPPRRRRPRPARSRGPPLLDRVEQQPPLIAPIVGCRELSRLLHALDHFGIRLLLRVADEEVGRRARLAPLWGDAEETHAANVPADRIGVVRDPVFLNTNPVSGGRFLGTRLAIGNRANRPILYTCMGMCRVCEYGTS